VQDLVSRLELTRFGAVVIVIDACRDFPFPVAFRLGGLGFDGPGPDGPPARIFLLQATLPGRSARGRAVDGVVRGDFTLAVLDALTGVGMAKRYDDSATRPYIVDWAGLATYVETAVPHQQPRGRGDGSLVLATFPDGWFEPVALTVEVDPDAVRTDPGLLVRVTYQDPTAPEDPLFSSAGPTPVRLEVPPRRHRVTAAVGDRWDRRAVDVYTDTTVRLSVTGQGPASRRPLAPDVVVRGDRTDGALRVTVDDPVAPVEVRTLSGSPLLAGVGGVFGALPPGQYTVASLDHAARERLDAVEVERRFEAELAIDLPPPDEPAGSADPGDPVLRWAGAAALHARRYAAAEPAAGGVVCVVTGPGVPVPDRAAAHYPGGASRPAALDHDHVGGYRTATVRSVDGDWLTVSIGGHTVTVPIAAGVIAVVTAITGPVSAALYEIAALAEPYATLALDRAQRLIAAGRLSAASRILRAVDSPPGPHPVRSALAEATGEGPPTAALHHGLAAHVAAADRAYLLPNDPWAVFLDHPGMR
jgi:hypothetical protein